MKEESIILEEKKTNIMLVDKGNYTLETVKEQAVYAQWLIDNKLVSDTFKTPSQLIVAIQLCKDLELPNSALSNFYVIKGRPAIYGDVLIGLVMDKVSKKSVVFFDEEGVVITYPKKGQMAFGCAVTYGRVKVEGEVTGVYTMDDRDTSLTTNPTWVKYPKDMLWRRADVRAIKMLFPDTFKGIEVVEYLEESVDYKKTTRIVDNEKISNLNELFSSDN